LTEKNITQQIKDTLGITE